MKQLLMIIFTSFIILQFHQITSITTRSYSATTPLFRFGIIADVQYANVPDSLNFQQTKYRRYHQSLSILQQALHQWHREFSSAPNIPSFSIILGDLIDGKSNNVIEKNCLNDFLQITSASSLKCFYTHGNHCHYSMTRNEIYNKFCPKFDTWDGNNHFGPGVGGICDPNKIYYDWSPSPGWRFISLDSYDISLIGASNIKNEQKAKELLKEHNPNDLTISGGWFNNLPREKHRWVPYNGGISHKQLLWLEQILSYSKKNNENVVIYCHQPIYAPNNPKCLIWNAEEVLQLLWDYGNVKLWLAGHDHGGQYSIDSYGIHHMVPPAPIECDLGETSFGHINVFNEYFEVIWTGKIPQQSILAWPSKMKFNRILESINKY